jgi:ribosomal protein S18 acetylase RimI-like enzyme
VLDTLADHLPTKRVIINGNPTHVRREGIAYVSNLAVSPAAQRRGVGGRLLSAGERLAAEWGCRSVALHVDPGNIPAVELYRRCGYRKAGRQPEWQRVIEGRPTALTLMIKVLPRGG